MRRSDRDHSGGRTLRRRWTTRFLRRHTPQSVDRAESVGRPDLPGEPEPKASRRWACSGSPRVSTTCRRELLRISALKSCRPTARSLGHRARAMTTGHRHAAHRREANRRTWAAQHRRTSDRVHSPTNAPQDADETLAPTTRAPQAADRLGLDDRPGLPGLPDPKER